MVLQNFKLVTKADAASVFGVCVKTIDNYIKEGRLPKPVDFVSREYWHPADFQAFLDRTFLRQTRPSQTSFQSSDAPSSAMVEPANTALLPAAAPRMPVAVPRDSDPMARQQAKQKARLRALNAPSAN